MTLASGLLSPEYVAVDATSVYFTDPGAGKIMKLGLTGGAPPVALATSENAPGSLVVDSTNVYWVDSGSLFTTRGLIRQEPLAGGTPTTRWVGASPQSIAVDSSNLYWTDTEGSTTAGLWKIPLSGAGCTPLAIGSGTAWGVAVGGGVYWTDPDLTVGVVNQYLPDVGTFELATAQAEPTAIAASAATVAWIDVLGATVMQVPSGGAAPVTVAAGQDSPWEVTVDDTSIYWTNQGTAPSYTDGTIMKAPISGGRPLVLASGQQQPYGIAVDGASVYWANSGGGAILEVAK